MICNRCNTNNWETARYCQECGHSFGGYCQHCAHPLPRNAKFCIHCGLATDKSEALTPATPVAPAMPVGVALPPGTVAAPTAPTPIAPAPPPVADSASLSTFTPQLDRFLPPELATKLKQARATGAMQGERRVVTMLFCDVKGSTAAAEQLDPEEWTEIINGAFEQMIQPVYKYEGTVARLMGDAILAFFGAPIAHEDDPQRAILAGMEIVQGFSAYQEETFARYGLRISARVGINTGLVVVGAVGSDLRMEYTAMGDAINLAARMEQTAQPGTVQVAEDTYRLTEPIFDFESLGGIEVKGKSEPVPAYRVLGRKQTPGRLRGFGGASAPLVGRQAERDALTAAATRLRAGSGGIVWLEGVAGLGKSRLVDELKQIWQSTESNGQPPSASSWLETVSYSYETGQPYSLFQRLFRRLAGATSNDSPAEVQAKLDRWMGELSPELAGQARLVLSALFSASTEPHLSGEAFKRELFDYASALCRHLTSLTATVLVLDDLHWTDLASVELVQHLLPLCAEMPLLFLCASRPEAEAPATAVKTAAGEKWTERFVQISLQPLTDSESSALVDGLLRIKDIPATLQATIQEKAQGNPFFVEEVVRTLLDSGLVGETPEGSCWLGDTAVHIEIPDNVQSLITARIDRLPDETKRVLQLAALIGRTFYYRILAVIVAAQESGQGNLWRSSLEQPVLASHLATLEEADMVHETARIPEPEYAFRHALTQEAAYSTMLLKQRRIFHLRVGEAIEQLLADQLESHAVELAYHFGEAQDAVRSMKYHTMAGDTAYRLYALTEAIQHYSTALNLAKANKTTSEQWIHLLTRLGRSFELAARMQEASEHYASMAEQAEKLADGRMRLAALMPLATLYSIASSLHDPEKAAALSSQTLTLAQDTGDRAAESKILWNMQNSNRLAGRTQEALACGERSLAIAKELNLREQIAFTQTDLCHIYNSMGLYARAKQALEETQGLWRDLDNRPMLADSLSTASYVNAYTGDYEASLAFSQEARAISESVHNVWGISFSLWTAGSVYWELGRPQQAIEVMGECIHYSDKAGFVIAQTYLRTDLAGVYAELGEMEQARALIQEAIAVAEEGNAHLLPYIYARSALLAIARGELTAAKEMLAAIWAKDAPINVVQPRLLTLADCLLPLAQGAPHRTVQCCQERMTDLKKYGLRIYIPETLLLWGRALVAIGKSNEAEALFQEALDFTQILGARWIEWQILTAWSKLQPNVEDGRSLGARARDLIENIADDLEEPELKNSFMAREDVQQVLVDSFPPSIPAIHERS